MPAAHRRAPRARGGLRAVRRAVLVPRGVDALPVRVSWGDYERAVERTESNRERVVWVRHPADLARMVLAVAVWLVVYGYGLVYPDDARSLSARLVVALDGLPPTVTRTTIGLVQLGIDVHGAMVELAPDIRKHILVEHLRREPAVYCDRSAGR